MEEVKIVKRIFAMLMVALVMVASIVVTAATVFAAPNCTGPPDERPASCLTSTKGQEEPGGGPPGPGNFVGPGGGNR